MKKIVLALLIISGWATSACAQSIGPSILNAAGGSAVIGSDEFEWSIGEMTMVSTLSSSSVVITQGLLQPMPVTLGVPSVNPLAQQLKVFPNPASSIVNVEYTSQAKGSLTYRLLDVAGKTIKSKTTQVDLGSTIIGLDIADLVCAGYLLEVTVNSGNEAKGKASFNIQKIE